MELKIIKIYIAFIITLFTFFLKEKRININYNTTLHNPSNLELEKSSRDYWENRYANGGNSGCGSYII